MQTIHDLKVAVVGAGICGLACAVALQKAGINVDVFESATTFRPIEAGIGLGPNAVRALERMGILEPFLQKLPPGFRPTVKGFLLYSGLGNHELLYDYPPQPELSNLNMQRMMFLDVLLAQLEPQHMHFNKRCASVSESPTNPKALVLSFLDGTTHDADIVLGADGIKSSVRKYVIGANTKGTTSNVNAVAFSNTTIYRGMLPGAVLKDAGFKTPLIDRPSCFVGPDKHIHFFSLRNAEIVAVIISCTNYDVPLGSQILPEESTWIGQTAREDIQKEFEGWGSDVNALLKCIPEKMNRWSLHVVHPPLGSYARGRAVLLGDAAHGMAPHLGAGAGQGLEDALLLVRLLSHPTTRDNVETVLQAYSTVRRPRAQDVWELSDRAGRAYDHRGLHGPTPEAIRKDLTDVCDPIWHYDLDNEFASALRILREDRTFNTQ